MSKARWIRSTGFFAASAALSACGLIVGSETVKDRSNGANTGGGGGAGFGYRCVFALDFGSDAGQELGGVAQDGQNHLWLAGTYQGTPQAGKAPLPAPGGPNERNMFLLELDPAGPVLFAEGFDLGAVDAKLGIAGVAAANGDIYVAGQFAGARDLGGPCSAKSPADDDPDAFIAHFDTAGACKAIQPYNNSPTDQAAGIATDGKNVVLAGTVNNGNGMFLHGYDDMPTTDHDAFFTATRGSISPHAVAMKGDQMLVGGDFFGNFDISANNGAELDSGSDTTPNAFLAMYYVSRLGKTSPVAPYHWSEDYGSPGEQSIRAVAGGTIAGADAFLAAGSFEKSLDFTSDKQGHRASAGGKDALIAAITADDGKPLWFTQLGDGADQVATAVAYHPSYGVLVAGAFQGTIKLGDTQLQNSDAGDHLFLGRLTEAGAPAWGAMFGENGIQSVHTLAVLSDGDVILGGSYTGKLNFGCQPLETSGPTPKLFLARLKLESP